MNSRDHIYRLIAQGEHQELDFKYEMNDSRKIARTLSAFANTDGGRLLVGVKDNGKIVGVDTQEEIYMVEAAAQVFSTPEVNFQGKLHEVEGKDVLEVIIQKSEEKHYVKEETGPALAYIRKGDMTLKASSVLIRIWHMKKNIKGQNFTYGSKEELLFKYLKEHGEISFNKYCKISKQHYKKAMNTLARLVIWNVIEMDETEKGVRYILSIEHDRALKKLEHKEDTEVQVH
jgi:predicted HTH transcriptional regulator